MEGGFRKKSAPPHSTPPPRSLCPRRRAGTTHDDARRSFINSRPKSRFAVASPSTNRHHVWLRRQVHALRHCGATRD
jgi:hypothetical protein